MDVIGTLLKASLLEAVGDDADRATKLRDAATTMAENLRGARREMVPAVAAGIVCPGNGDWTPFEVAREHLVAHWETFANAYPEAPHALFRAVSATALAEAVDDERILIAAWYSIRNALDLAAPDAWTRHLNVLLEDWTGRIGDLVAQRWDPPLASASVRMPSMKDPAAFTMQSREGLIEEAKALLGTNDWQQLLAKYPDHVERLIRLAEAAGHVGSTRAHDAVKTAWSTLGARLREAFEQYEAGLEGTRLRGELVWWYQTAFSPSQKCCYDELSTDSDVAIVAASDLHDLVPDIAPPAAEHLLRRTVRGVVEGEAELTVADLSCSDYVAQLPGLGATDTPASLAASVRDPDRLSVLSFVDRPTHPAETVAVHLFRDLQAAAVLAPRSEE